MDKPVYDCHGHWDPNLQWREGHIWPQDAILADLIAEIERRKAAGKAHVPPFPQES